MKSDASPLPTAATSTPEPVPPLLWLYLLLQTFLGIGLAVWLLTNPAVFNDYYPRLGFESHLHDARAVVDWMSTHYRERSLNEALQNGHFIPKELKHYSAVRRVFQEVPRFTIAFAFLAFLILAVIRPSRQALASAERMGLFVWMGILILLGLFGWWDWKQLFAWIHEPLFGSTSWRLPDSSYSLRLFPTAFWKDMAAIVLLTPTLLFLALWLAMGRSSPRKEDLRTCADSASLEPALPARRTR